MARSCLALKSCGFNPQDRRKRKGGGKGEKRGVRERGKEREGRRETKEGETKEQNERKKRKGKESYKPCEGWVHYAAAPPWRGQDWEYPHTKPLAFNTIWNRLC